MQIVLAYTTDRKKLNKRRKDFIGKNHVIFTINGQVHGSLDKKLIRYCGLNYLRDDLLIHINCTKVEQNFGQDLFMANRSNVKNTVRFEKFEKKIISVIKNNDNLRSLHNKRKIELTSGHNQSEKNIIDEALSNNPKTKDLLNLLKNKGHLNFLGSQKNKKQAVSRIKNSVKKPTVKKKTRRFPSIFKINLKEKNGKRVKGIPLGSKGYINFETDVDSNYFYRPHDAGKLALDILGYGKESKRHGGKKFPTEIKDSFNVSKSSPNNQSIKIMFEPRKTLSVGDEIKVSAKLSNPSGDMEVIFYIRIDEENKNEKKNINQIKENGLNWPPIIKIRKEPNKGWVKDNGEDWKDVEWNEDSVVKILSEDSSSIDAIAINISSNVFERYRTFKKADTEQKLEITRKEYIALVYLNSLFLYSSMLSSEFKEKDIDIADAVSNLFKKFGEAILYINPTQEILKYYE